MKEFKEGKEIKEKDKDFEGKPTDKLGEVGGQFGVQPAAAPIEQRLACAGAGRAATRALHRPGAAARPQPVGAAGKQPGGKGREGPEGRREDVGRLMHAGGAAAARRRVLK